MDESQSAGDGDSSPPSSLAPTPTPVPTPGLTPTRLRSMRTRVVSGVILGLGALAAILGGHITLGLLTMFLCGVMHSEVISIGYRHKQVGQLDIPFFRSLGWYFFVIGMYFTTGRQLTERFRLNFTTATEWRLERHHVLISFCLYVLGFVAFVSLLRRGLYKYQFRALAWTQLSVVVFCSMFSSSLFLMLRGNFWAIMPLVLVVINDTMAYFCGVMFGKTPLTALSPKKTWEGFFGAAFFTVVLGTVILSQFASSPRLHCPVRWDQIGVFGARECRIPAAFELKEFVVDVTRLSGVVDAFEYVGAGDVVDWLRTLLPITITYREVWGHTAAIAVLVSVVGPFGGFFASGIKRAYGLSDFGDSIPGHGGAVDRLDCVTVMAIVTAVYYRSFVGDSMTASQVLKYLETLTSEDRIRVFEGLKALLYGT